MSLRFIFPTKNPVFFSICIIDAQSIFSLFIASNIFSLLLRKTQRHSRLWLINRFPFSSQQRCIFFYILTTKFHWNSWNPEQQKQSKEHRKIVAHHNLHFFFRCIFKYAVCRQVFWTQELFDKHCFRVCVTREFRLCILSIWLEITESGEGRGGGGSVWRRWDAIQTVPTICTCRKLRNLFQIQMNKTEKKRRKSNM